MYRRGNNNDLQDHVVFLETELKSIKIGLQEFKEELQELDKSIQVISNKKTDWLQIGAFVLPVVLTVSTGIYSMSMQLQSLGTSLDSMSNNLNEFKSVSKEEIRRIEGRLNNLEGERWKKKE